MRAEGHGQANGRRSRSGGRGGGVKGSSVGGSRRPRAGSAPRSASQQLQLLGSLCSPHLLSGLSRMRWTACLLQLCYLKSARISSALHRPLWRPRLQGRASWVARSPSPAAPEPPSLGHPHLHPAPGSHDKQMRRRHHRWSGPRRRPCGAERDLWEKEGEPGPTRAPRAEDARRKKGKNEKGITGGRAGV
jgi:hypothetical protein